MLTPAESEVLNRWTDPNADEFSRLPMERSPLAKTLFLDPAQLAHCLFTSRATGTPLETVCQRMAATLDDVRLHMLVQRTGVGMMARVNVLERGDQCICHQSETAVLDCPVHRERAVLEDAHPLERLRPGGSADER